MGESYSFISRLLKKIIERCESIKQARKSLFLQSGIYAAQLSCIHRPDPKLVLNNICGYLPLCCRTRV